MAPFWGEVIKTAFTTEGITGLLKAGWTTIKGALVSPAAGLQLRWLAVFFHKLKATPGCSVCNRWLLGATRVALHAVPLNAGHAADGPGLPHGPR